MQVTAQATAACGENVASRQGHVFAPQQINEGRPSAGDAIAAARDPAVRDEFERDLDSSWEKVAHATVDSAARTTHWRNWSVWCDVM
jgi:hypothetical protein